MNQCRAAADVNFDPSDPRVSRTQAAVYEAGLELLFRDGTMAITHASLAQATGRSRTTLYKHWPTRVDLVIDICNQIEPDEHIAPSGDVRTDLVRMVEHLAETLRDPFSRRAFSSMIAEAQSDPEAREVSNAMTGSVVGDLAEVFGAAADSGDFPAGVDPVRAAGRLYGPLFVAALVFGEPVPNGEAESIVDGFLASVRS